MRAALTEVQRRLDPEHLGLAYEMWAPIQPGEGKVPGDAVRPWLDRLGRMKFPAGYEAAFARWKESFAGAGADGPEFSSEVFEIKLASRLLVGHGNPAPTDVGLSVQHTWGVPYIPGSALKGLAANYVDACYGPEQPLGTNPRAIDPGAEEAMRAAFAGVTWQGLRIKHGPGEAYAEIFGAPAAEDDAKVDGAGERQGLVTFYDAWLVPAGGSLPVALDVLTVHQRTYYNREGSEGGPNDFDSPNPVSFLTVTPGARFLVALSGRSEWVALARRLLVEALEAWGIGGKTTSGYGRIVPAAPKGVASTAAGKRLENCVLVWKPGQSMLEAVSGSVRAVLNGQPARELLAPLTEKQRDKAKAGSLKVQWVEIEEQGNMRVIKGLGPLA